MKIPVKRYVRRSPRPPRRRQRRESLVGRGLVTDISFDAVGYGVTDPGVLILREKGRKRKAIVKTTRGDFVNYIAESVADTIDDLLGWNIVPPTTARIVSGVEEQYDTKLVTVQEWIEKGRWRNPTTGQIMKVAVLDFIIGNRDRHTGNLLFDRQGKLWAIDNGHSLRSGPGTDFQAYNKYALDKVSGASIPSRILRDLESLNEGDLRAAVAPMGNPDIVDGVVFRWKLLMRNRRMPISTRGEGFDNWADYKEGKEKSEWSE